MSGWAASSAGGAVLNKRADIFDLAMWTKQTG